MDDTAAPFVPTQEFFDEAWPKLQTELSKCFVVLSIITRTEDAVTPEMTLDRHRPRVMYRSGFILRVQYSWIFVTAGHKLEDLELLKDPHSGVKVGRAVFFHGYDDVGREVSLSTEFKYDPRRLLAIFSHGLDCAIYPLDDETAQTLSDKGVRFVDMTQVHGEGDGHPDLFALLGLPEIDPVTHSDSGATRTFHLPAVVPMLAGYWERNPPADFRPPVESFCVRILTVRGVVQGEKKALQSLKGMSGGPVFALTFTDGPDGFAASPRLAGIVSHYRKVPSGKPGVDPTFYVAAAWIRPVVRGIDALIKKARGKRDGSQD